MEYFWAQLFACVFIIFVVNDIKLCFSQNGQKKTSNAVICFGCLFVHFANAIWCHFPLNVVRSFGACGRFVVLMKFDVFCEQ